MVAPDATDRVGGLGRLDVRCTDGAGDHRAAWDDLVDRSPLASPFLRWWWLDAVRVDTPATILVLDGDRLVGGLALEVRRRRGVPWYRHVGDAMGDHLDVLALEGHEGAVAEALQTWWQRPGPRVLEVGDGVAAGGLLGAGFPRGSALTPGSPAPYASLPASFDEYLGRLPGELRSTVTRSTRRLERDGVVHRVVDRPDEADRALDALRTLHGSRWADRSGFLPSFARFADAARAGLAAGEVVFHELVHDGTVIACEVDFEVAGRTSFFQSGRLEDRRWRGSGSVLRAKVIERACGRGHHEYDLLRGAEPYKDAWADGTRQLGGVRAAHGALARAALMTDDARRVARAVRRRLAARRGSEGGS